MLLRSVRWVSAGHTALHLRLYRSSRNSLLGIIQITIHTQFGEKRSHDFKAVPVLKLHAMKAKVECRLSPIHASFGIGEV
jgi:hypothetical protein